MDALAQELTLEMLSEGTYRDIAAEIGVENFYRLCGVVGGSTIYLPKQESIVRPVRDARIKAEYNGYNHPDLAKKYGVTVRWVEQLCGKGKLEGQMDMMELLDNS